jgi:16S rRNA processing protein RimM
LIEILRVIGAFGIHGALRVFPFSKKLNCYRKIYDKNKAEFTFRVVKFCGNGRVIICIDDITDRNMAESLIGEVFYIKKSDLAKIEKNEIYLCDLIGREVHVLNSDIKCKITNAENFGAGDLIEISHDNVAFLVPFTERNFPNVGDQIYITSEAFNGFKN